MIETDLLQSLFQFFYCDSDSSQAGSVTSTPYWKFLCKFSRIFFRVYKFRNGGVAGYVEYSGLVQSGK